jgi:glutamate carboxypeptidase
MEKSSPLHRLKDLRLQLPQITSRLLSWVDINSGTENVAGLEIMANALQDAFAPLGGTIQLIPLPSRLSIDSKGKQISYPVGQALRIVKRPELPYQILLAGHMDSVFPAHSHFQRGQLIGSDKMIGPASADMKGGLMIMLKALELFESSPYASELGWEVLINPDEEIGSPCSEGLFRDAAKRCQAALLFEPSFPDGSLVSARKGSANYTAIAHGRAAHVGRDFHSGHSAIASLAHFISAVDKLNDPLSDLTINIGHIEGGGPVNIVPDLAICRLNVRASTEASFGQVENKLKQFAKELSPPDLSIEIVKGNFRGPKPFNTSTEKMFERMRRCGQQLDIDLKWRPSGGVCDGNIMAAEGVPTIDTLGGIGGGIHTDMEYLMLNSLVERAKLTALFLIDCASNPKLLLSKFSTE